jgi:hypothetical protein
VEISPQHAGWINRPLRFSACGKIFDVSYAHMLLIGVPDAYAQKRQVVLLVPLDFKDSATRDCGLLLAGFMP